MVETVEPRPLFVEIAKRLPPWLGWLATWLIERETARAEAIARRVADTVAAFAREALYVPPPLPEWMKFGNLQNASIYQPTPMMLQQAMYQNQFESQFRSQLAHQQVSMQGSLSSVLGSLLGSMPRPF